MLLAASVSANPFAPAQTENSAKAEFMSRLLSKATPIRQLNNNNNNNNAAANVDLTAYSVVFKKCQFVKTYSDNLAYSGSSTVLATERFVIFRLCPSGSYCTACSSNYGEYIIDLYDYLYATVTFQKEVQTANCTTCSNDCAAYATDDKVAQNEAAVAADDGQVGQGGRFLSSSSNSAAKACKSCLDQCKFIDNYQNEGYYDATDFITCTKIYDDGSTILYAGPMCSNSGSKIKIGVFTDDTCYVQDTSKDPNDYLQGNNGAHMMLSYHLMKETYTSSCVSCAYDNNGVEETSQFCQTLYQKSAKCQDPSSVSGEDAVQTSDETLVCNFISSLSAGTYSESGEINISGASSVIHGGAKTSGGQKFALTFFILGTVGLAAYAAMLHSKLTKGPKAELGSADGAMA